MNTWFIVGMLLLIIVATAMILIILVQRPQGGGLAGAFGGAGGGGDSVFGGRVGDALTVLTIIAFLLYIGLAIGLNLLDTRKPAAPIVDVVPVVDPAGGDPVVSPPLPGDGITPLPGLPDGSESRP